MTNLCPVDRLATRRKAMVCRWRYGRDRLVICTGSGPGGQVLGYFVFNQDRQVYLYRVGGGGHGEGEGYG